MTAIGAAYKPQAIQSVLGPDHSDLIPNNLWGGWLDSSGNIIGETGIQVPHAVFAQTATGVINTDVIDAGTCPATVPHYFALLDAGPGGSPAVVLRAFIASFNDPDNVTVVPDEDDVMSFAVGALAFDYA